MCGFVYAYSMCPYACVGVYLSMWVQRHTKTNTKKVVWSPFWFGHLGENAFQHSQDHTWRPIATSNKLYILDQKSETELWSETH